MKINILSFVVVCAASFATLSSGALHAQQTFTATLDGKSFESDDDGITVVPTKSSVSISARTKGYGAYPPPKGFADRISIVCPLPKVPTRFATVGSGGTCTIQWVIAGRSMMDADYKTTPNEGDFVSSKSSGKGGFVNYTKVAGKTIEGEFSAELIDAKTKKKVVAAGKFKGVDAQMGSKGFN
jgi:hypothetical protein